MSGWTSVFALLLPCTYVVESPVRCITVQETSFHMMARVFDILKGSHGWAGY
jgi:hypothetical protein